MTAVMLYLGRMYAKLGWTMQLHIGAIRNNNTRMFREVGRIQVLTQSMITTLPTHYLGS